MLLKAMSTRLKKPSTFRKAEVDEDRKETRLQGLKDQLAASDSDGVDQLRDEVEEPNCGSRN